MDKELRKRLIPDLAYMGLFIIGLLAPYWLEFNRTDTLIWIVGLIVLWNFKLNFRRLDTLQPSLAKMESKLREMDNKIDRVLIELSEDGAFVHIIRR
jgi:hypothetical protein